MTATIADFPMTSIADLRRRCHDHGVTFGVATPEERAYAVGLGQPEPSWSLHGLYTDVLFRSLRDVWCYLDRLDAQFPNCH